MLTFGTCGEEGLGALESDARLGFGPRSQYSAAS